MWGEQQQLLRRHRSEFTAPGTAAASFTQHSEPHTAAKPLSRSKGSQQQAGKGERNHHQTPFISSLFSYGERAAQRPPLPPPPQTARFGLYLVQ